MPESLQAPWYNKTVDALQLAGMSEITQESYARAVRMLIEHFGKDPRQITEGRSFRSISYTSGMKPGGRPVRSKICYCALKFFFINVLQQDWHLFNILKTQSEAPSLYQVALGSL